MIKFGKRGSNDGTGVRERAKGDKGVRENVPLREYATGREQHHRTWD